MILTRKTISLNYLELQISGLVRVLDAIPDCHKEDMLKYIIHKERVKNFFVKRLEARGNNLLKRTDLVVRTYCRGDYKLASGWASALKDIFLF